jgi:hypothetical protein
LKEIIDKLSQLFGAKAPFEVFYVSMSLEGLEKNKLERLTLENTPTLLSASGAMTFSMMKLNKTAFSMTAHSLMTFSLNK